MQDRQRKNKERKIEKTEFVIVKKKSRRNEKKGK